MLGGRSGQALKQRDPAAYYAKYVAPQLDRGGAMGAAANVERQRLLKTITNQAVNPGLDIRPSPGAAVVAMAKGVPVYGQVQAASATETAPSGSGGGGGGGGGGSSSTSAQLSEDSKKYRSQAEEKLAAAKLKIAELEDPQKQAAKAKALQERLRIISSANLARSSMAPKLQIAPASQLPTIGGTQQFKRRQQSTPTTFNMLNI